MHVQPDNAHLHRHDEHHHPLYPFMIIIMLGNNPQAPKHKQQYKQTRSPYGDPKQIRHYRVALADNP